MRPNGLARGASSAWHAAPKMAFRSRDPAWCNTAEGARVLRVSLRTCGRLVATGELERCGVTLVRTPGGHARLLRADLERIVPPPDEAA
jgi:hypothetical protein